MKLFKREALIFALIHYVFAAEEIKEPVKKPFWGWCPTTDMAKIDKMDIPEALF